jgi:hypothetical protein
MDYIRKNVKLYNFFQGKEFETRLKEKKPGNLSDDLKTALGMPIGPVSITLLSLNLQQYLPFIVLKLDK